MATNEMEKEPEATRTERAVLTLHKTSEAISYGSPMRVFLSMIVIAVCLTFAPFPANIIGIVALVIMCMWFAAPPRLRLK